MSCYGEARGDELPPEISTRQGRQKWLREAQRALDERRAREQRPIPRSRPKRLKESKRRLEEQLWTECRANAAYEAFRARGVMRNGRRMGPATTPKPYTPPEHPAGEDQHDRSGLAVGEGDGRLAAGLQRAGRHQ